MTSTLATPPTDVQPNGERGPAPRNGAARPVAIILIAIGALVLLGTVANAIVSTVLGASRSTESTTADARGLTAFDIDAADGRVAVVFDDVDEAVLEVTGNASGGWTLERVDDTLRVASPSTFLGWWGSRGQTEVTLTLPAELEDAALDADFSLSAGEIVASGTFGDLVVEVGAGSLQLDGSADALDLELSAGRADVELANLSRAALSVAAGRAVTSFTGNAPDSVEIDVSAGSLDLTLPVARYDVRSDVSAGSLDNDLDTSAGASNEVSVTVSAGSVRLDSAR